MPLDSPNSCLSWSRADQREDFRVRDHPGDLPIEVTYRDIVVLQIVRRNAVGRHDDVIVSLISVEDRHPNTRMRVYAGHDQILRPKFGESFLQIGTEKGAVALEFTRRGSRNLTGLSRARGWATIAAHVTWPWLRNHGTEAAPSR